MVFGLVLLLATSGHAEPSEREAFLLHCSGCHGDDGRGDGRIVPDLTALGSLLEREGARDYLVRVPGVAQAPVGDAALGRLLDFVVRELAGASDVAPFSAAEVAAGRARPLRDPVTARPGARQ